MLFRCPQRDGMIFRFVARGFGRKKRDARALGAIGGAAPQKGEHSAEKRRSEYQK